jgi:hypothetical protein
MLYVGVAFFFCMVDFPSDSELTLSSAIRSIVGVRVAKLPGTRVIRINVATYGPISDLPRRGFAFQPQVAPRSLQTERGYLGARTRPNPGTPTGFGQLWNLAIAATLTG